MSARDAARALALLDEVSGVLDRIGCQFFACPGPQAAVMVPMGTCAACWSRRQIGLFIARQERKRSGRPLRPADDQREEGMTSETWAPAFRPGDRTSAVVEVYGYGERRRPRGPVGMRVLAAGTDVTVVGVALGPAHAYHCRDRFKRDWWLAEDMLRPLP